MPDDGHRYELVDGTLVVTPSPSLRHQLVSGRLYSVLDRHCPSGLLVLAAPTDVRLADAPWLAVEILSPSTRHVDLSLKCSRYETAGCPAYWVVDPDALELTAWELHEHMYVEVAHVSGEEPYAATHPFPVEVVPAQLVR